MWSSRLLCYNKFCLINSSRWLVNKQGQTSTKSLFYILSWITFLKTLKFWKAFGLFTKLLFYLVMLHEVCEKVIKKKAWICAVQDWEVLTLACVGPLHQLAFLSLLLFLTGTKKSREKPCERLSKLTISNRNNLLQLQAVVFIQKQATQIPKT